MLEYEVRNDNRNKLFLVVVAVTSICCEVYGFNEFRSSYQAGSNRQTLSLLVLGTFRCNTFNFQCTNLHSRLIREREALGYARLLGLGIRIIFSLKRNRFERRFLLAIFIVAVSGYMWYPSSAS